MFHLLNGPNFGREFEIDESKINKHWDKKKKNTNDIEHSEKWV